VFVGHLALGFAGKRIEPAGSLGTWMLAVMLADLLVFPFLIAGIEHTGALHGVTTNRFAGDVPYSHSLLMDVVWAALFAAGYYVLRRHSRAAWLLFAAVLSHWVLDVISHRPDMALAPGVRVRLGLGLWNSVPATLIVEGGAWLLAVIVYVRASRAKNRVGVFALWIGIVLLTLSWYSNITAGMDPNPVRAGISGLVFFSIVIAWAYWIDRARAFTRV
jgi:hypothetical protein